MASVDGSAHANLEFDVSGRLKKGLLTRKGAVVNLPSYDAGRVYFATNGCDEGAKLGFIDVSYTVRLYNPQSSSSSIAPAITYVPAVPKYRAAFYPTSNVSSNVAEYSLTPFAGGPYTGPKTGATGLFTTTLAAHTAINLTYAGGCRFKHPATTTEWLNTVTSGRYRIKACFNMDYKDLYLFAMVPFKIPKGSTVPETTTELVLDDFTGTVSEEVISLPASHRGFSGVATGDPNPGTDMPFVGQWDVNLQSGDRLSVALGIRTYNDVSVTNADVIYRSGLGPTFVDIEFLGPV